MTMAVQYYEVCSNSIVTEPITHSKKQLTDSHQAWNSESKLRAINLDWSKESHLDLINPEPKFSIVFNYEWKQHAIVVLAAPVAPIKSIFM